MVDWGGGTSAGAGTSTGTGTGTGDIAAELRTHTRYEPDGGHHIVLTIRHAGPDDALAIAEVHVASWRETYRGLVPDAFLDALSVATRERMWHDALGADRPGATDQPSVVLVVSDADSRVVGFASGGARRDG